MECIVLAGGLGTRLQSVIGAQPKCMAPVNGQPFLYYLFQYIAAQKCDRVILSLGFKAEVVLDWLPQHNWPFAIDHVIEQEPLGTGGGIQLAMKAAHEEDVTVLNGDTMFMIDMSAMLAAHKASSALTTLALKNMQQFDRYGVVNTSANNTITSFEEKQYKEDGTINGGVYIISRQAFLAKQLPEKFSFEKDYLERFVSDEQFGGYTSDAYFIDIGIPVDYQQAQEDFKKLFV